MDLNEGGNPSGGYSDEYAKAHILVRRAADREAALSGANSGHEEAEGCRPARRGDFSNLRLKLDHPNRPCWVCPNGTIYLEAFHDMYASACDFLVTIGEPVARPQFVHQYKLTPYTLYAAVATNIDTESIIRVLDHLSKNVVSDSVTTFIRDCTKRYGKAKLLLKSNRFYVESEHPSVLKELLRDPLIAQARVAEDMAADVDADGFTIHRMAEEMEENLIMLRGAKEHDIDTEHMDIESEPKENPKSSELLSTLAFQVKAEYVETVKKQALELDYPLMEEYDFRNDRVNPDIPMDLKPNTRIRQYQERSLARMFGNGRARSGIIVLPCGAGKTLTGVTASQTIKKSVICLCTSSVSVLQWKYQFKLWTNIAEERIACFTADKKDPIHPEGCVLITTYQMISHSGTRNEQGAAVMDAICGKEWGLMLMDEVHVVAARTFRKVVGRVKAHCRLGLTATLVREDDLIFDLNFLVGPKLYEANWMDLTAQGYLAKVQCAEIWCPMTGPFMRAYLAASKAELKKNLYVLNPRKIRTVQYLVKFHEERGDKTLVFGDLVYSLERYAKLLKRPLICGKTPEIERQAILGLFRSSDTVRTVCISKVGDTSIDLPEANVIIQVSSHFGARRTEAQRLGRILRPKTGTQRDGSNRLSFNAFFYTLVSTDTQEMFFSSKRQQYLIDQGYTFKIVTELCHTADTEAQTMGFPFSTPEEEQNLLRELLEKESELERYQQAEDGAIASIKSA